MGYLEEREISGIRQDIKNNQAKSEVEKIEFEKKLNSQMGEEMKDLLEHPEKFQKYVKYAKKKQKNKWWERVKENVNKIFRNIY